MRAAFIKFTFLFTLLSLPLAAAEYRADLSSLERAKDLPSFPFKSVVDDHKCLPDKTRQESIIKAAQHLRAYGNTAEPDKQSGYYAGYIKLIAENERLFRDEVKTQQLEEIHDAIQNNQASEHVHQIHSSIWLGFFITKREALKQPEEQNQQNYLRAYNLWLAAKGKGGSDSCLLWMAELYIRRGFNLAPDGTPVDEQGRLEIAEQLLSEVGQAYEQQRERLRSQLTKGLPSREKARPPKKRPVATAATHMNSNQQQNLLRELKLELESKKRSSAETESPPEPQLSDEKTTENSASRKRQREQDADASSKSSEAAGNKNRLIMKTEQKLIKTIDGMNLSGKTLTDTEWQKQLMSISQAVNLSHSRVLEYLTKISKTLVSDNKATYRQLIKAANQMRRARAIENIKNGKLTVRQNKLLQELSVQLSDPHTFVDDGDQNKEQWENATKELQKKVDYTISGLQHALTFIAYHRSLTDAQQHACKKMSNAAHRLAAQERSNKTHAPKRPKILPTND